MNQVSLIGRMTKEPQLKQMGEGRAATRFVLAVNRPFQSEAEADFILVTVWGRSAINTVKYCGKGSLVGVSGRIQTRSYEPEPGRRTYVTEVAASEVKFLVTKARAADTAGLPQDAPVEEFVFDAPTPC